jgi:hypothetical protein
MSASNSQIKTNAPALISLYYLHTRPSNRSVTLNSWNVVIKSKTAPDAGHSRNGVVPFNDILGRGKGH